MASDLDDHVDDDSISNGNNLGSNNLKAEESAHQEPTVIDDSNQVDDDHAFDEDIDNAKQVIVNYNFFNSNIAGSAFGSHSSVISKGGKRKTGKAENISTQKKDTGPISDWDDWFIEKQFHEMIFIVSLLFFSGNHPRFVENVANELVDLYDIPSSSEDEEPSIFDDKFSIDNLLEDEFVTISRETINTEAGLLDFDSISIKNDEALSTIKQMVMEDHRLRTLRTKVRIWLENHIKSNNEEIKSLGSYSPELSRIQAGLGIGLLIRAEDEPLSVINSWANSKIANDRLMVGWLLLGYFEEDSQSDYWKTVSTLLEHWSSLKNSYYYRWSAIASTTRLGLIASPDDDASLVLSLSIYKEVCRSGDVNLFRGKFRGVLLKSLRFLFGLSSYHARTITNELASWITDDEISFIPELAAELFVEIVGMKIVVDEEHAGFKYTSIWELCEVESYTLSDAVFKLIHQALLHQKGTFVDYTVASLSRSLTKFLERDILPNKKVKRIFDDLRSDEQTAKYVPLILESH